MTNSTQPMSYCAGDTLSRAHSQLSMVSMVKPLILDVRRPAAMEAIPRTIPGAILASDLSEISKHAAFFSGVSKVRLFCVHGYERSISASVIVQTFGCDIEDIPGGLEVYEKAGGETVKIVNGKTGLLGSPRLWLFDYTVEDIFAAWVVARFIDPLSDYRFVPKAHKEKVLIELDTVGFASSFFPLADRANPLNALLEEFEFHDFSILTTTVISFLQQPATCDLLRDVSCEKIFAFCDHVWATAQHKNQTS